MSELKGKSYGTGRMKMYLCEENIYPTQISIDKVSFGDGAKLLFSLWYKDNSLLKKEDKEFDDCIESFREISSKEKLEIEFKNKRLKRETVKKIINANYISISRNFYKFEDNIQEYFIDRVFKKYPNNFFYFKDIIINNSHSDYILEYYLELLFHFFLYCPFEILETYKEELKTEKSNLINVRISEEIMKLITEKNLMDCKLDKMKNNF